MVGIFVSRVFPSCFGAIGGRANEDVRYILEGRPTEVTRGVFFQEVVWAIRASGISRKSAQTFCGRLPGFIWDFREVVGCSDEAWKRFLDLVYHYGIGDWERKKWAAVRTIARIVAAFADEADFRREFFSGKTASCELDKRDGWRLRARCLPWIGDANSQYVIRNMGGEAIKCDRWILALLDYLGITEAELEEELIAAGVSLSLFDVVVWAYCEAFVGRVADFRPHFDRLMAAAGEPEPVV
jgi:hypothetical protein